MKYYVVSKKTSKVRAGPFDTELKAKAEIFAFRLYDTHMCILK